MLHITVELWPGGIRDLARTLAIADIANVSDLADLDDYQVHAMEAANPLTDTTDWEATGRIPDHDRHSSVWSLVAKVADWAAEQAKGKKSAAAPPPEPGIA
ncbi:hypothetical protein [Bradyrhizobium australiense]|uniref:Uncharacterized protein n=1 Tax=Bradyrhizobium australiense TaxID=2721161 RepID=A0A7Y4GQW8_9BRAD|nr:hypothetical protein [Bradyrhizobium australiense]NOJ40325.1 hypothetical protein [Bradyrhizobium australiense]